MSAVKPVSSQSTVGITIKPLEWVYDSDKNCIDTLVIRSDFFNALRGGREPEACKSEDITEAQRRLELASKAATGQNLNDKEADDLVTLEFKFQKRYVRANMGEEAAKAMEVYKAFILQGGFSAKDKIAMTMMLSLMISTTPPSEARQFLIQGARQDGFIYKFIQDRRSHLADCSNPTGILSLAGCAMGAPDSHQAVHLFGYVIGTNDYSSDAFYNTGGSFLEMMDLMGFAGLARMAAKGLFKSFGSLIRNGVGGLADDLFRAGSALAGTRLGRGVNMIANCLKRGNSFTADTKVWVSQAANDMARKAKSTLEKSKSVAKTALTAVAISSIGVGSQVLAHNEQTKLERPQEVTATHEHIDPIMVVLKLETNNKKLETITTTPEHPFFALVEPNKRASGIWVNAGELQPNNWLRRANGEIGFVKSVSIEVKARKMYNLTVARDHTFFVGDGQWLVHNAGFDFQTGTGLAANFANTGFHLDYGKNLEVQIRFVNGELEASFKGGANLTATEMKQLKQFLNNNIDEVRRQLQMGLKNSDELGNLAEEKLARGEKLEFKESEALKYRREGRDLKFFLKNGCFR